MNLMDPCLSECHLSLMQCAKCHHVSVPDLFAASELNDEQRHANSLREVKWKQQQETLRTRAIAGTWDHKSAYYVCALVCVRVYICVHTLLYTLDTCMCVRTTLREK